MAAPARALLLLLLADLGAAQMSVNAMLAALSGNPPPAPPPGQQQRLKTEAPAPATPGVASFGLGCFWGGQISFDCAEGVSTTVVGYMGGQSVAGYAPAYTDYSEHGFTETVQLVYDAESSEAAYSALLEVFWASHNPTSAVVGSAYRSIIFAHTDEQDRLARRAIDTRNIELASTPMCRSRCTEATGAARVPCFLDGCAIFTTVEPANGVPFWPAEDYHQNWYAKLGETCASEGFLGRPWSAAVGGAAAPRGDGH